MSGNTLHVGGRVSDTRTANVATTCINLAYRKLFSVSPFLPPKLKQYFWCSDFVVL